MKDIILKLIREKMNDDGIKPDKINKHIEIIIKLEKFYTKVKCINTQPDNMLDSIPFILGSIMKLINRNKIFSNEKYRNYYLLGMFLFIFDDKVNLEDTELMSGFINYVWDILNIFNFKLNFGLCC